MSTKHRFIYKLQFTLLALLFFIYVFLSERISAGTSALLMLPVFFSEFWLLETERKIGVEKIYYRKSCFFALIDLASVLAFITYFMLFILAYFTGNTAQAKVLPFAAILLYTLARKIYIYKNFSYEK